MSKNKKAFSLVEIIVSLGIIGLIMTLFFNILITALTIGHKTLARSYVREEISTVANLITKDIKNSSYLIECGNEVCRINISGEVILWGFCAEETDKICKYENDELVFTSADSLIISELEFAEIFADTSIASNTGGTTVNLTVAGRHRDTTLNINNIFIHTAISTRNYEY